MTANEARARQVEILKREVDKIYQVIEDHINSKNQEQYIYWHEDLSLKDKATLEDEGYEIKSIVNPSNFLNAGVSYQISWKEQLTC